MSSLPSRLHVVFLNRSYAPEATATGQLLAELAEGLVSDHGCRVTVITGSPIGGPVLPAREIRQGVDVRRTAGTRLSKRSPYGRILNYLSYFATASSAGLHVSTPDIIVALTDPPIIGLSAWIAARLRGARFVMAYQDIFPEVARLLDDFKSETVEKILQFVNRFLAGRADLIIVLGDTMGRRLVQTKGADPARIRVIHNWADCSAIRPAAKPNSFSNQHNLNGKFVVMHSGNIGLSQDLSTLVDAGLPLAAVADLQIVFVGDGVRRTELEKRTQDLGLQNVSFIPFQPKDELTQSFAAADVFVVSLKAGLSGFIVPSKLYGILAAGRPFVAAVERDSEVAEIATQFQCGLLATPGDPADLAEKIMTFYRDPLLRRQYGENARRAGELFDRPIQIRRYYETLSSLA